MRITRPPVWLIGILVLAAIEAGACPRCTSERLFSENWHIKWLAINLAVPIVIVFNRLDLVRFLFVLIPYLCFAFGFHYFLFWNTFGIVNPVLSLLTTLGWVVWAFNLVGAALLVWLSRMAYFRRSPQRGLAPWQPVAYSLVVFILSMVAA